MARLLFVTQTAHPLGGVEAWLDDLAPSLAVRHEVILGLVRGRTFHDPERYLAARPVRFPSVTIESRTDTLEGRVRAVMQAIRRTRAELVAVINVADCLEAVRRLKREGRGPRLFYPLHAIGTDYLLDALDFSGVIDYAVGTSRLAERALLQLSRIDRTRLACVPYGVPPPVTPPVIEPHTPLRLLHLGRLVQQQKRVLDLIPLVTELDRRHVPYELTVAGSGPEEPQLRAALGSNPRVDFLGALSRAELYRDVYPRTDTLLLLSEWETGPLVAWEAMRNGSTVVSTRYLGLRAEGRLRDGDNALLADVGNVEQLASAIERLARDQALQVRLRRAAVETAELETRLESSHQGWHEAIERCLSLPPNQDAHDVSLPRTSGRLDRIAGPFAETVRRMIGPRMVHRDSGSEWPHSYRHSDPRREPLESAVAALDHR